MTRFSMLLMMTAALVAGCGDDDGGDDDDDDGTEGEGEGTQAFCTDGLDNDGDAHIDCFDLQCLPFQEDCAPPVFYDDVEDGDPPVASDFSCLHDNPPDDPPGGEVEVRFYSEDFQEGDRVEDNMIDVFFANRIEGDPDLTLGPTDDQGLTETVSVPAGSLLAVRTQAITNEVRLTIEFDVRTPTEAGEVRALSVSAAAAPRPSTSCASLATSGPSRTCTSTTRTESSRRRSRVPAGSRSQSGAWAGAG